MSNMLETVEELLVDVAKETPNVYNAGYGKGLIDGANNSSGDDYLKKFWGVRQNYGKATNYTYAFYGSSWIDEIYDPQHDFMVNSNVNSMFYGAYITDTKKPIDISGSNVKSNTNSIFQNSKIKRIEMLRLKEDGSNSLTKCFDGCNELEEINLEGKIGKSVSFVDCGNLKVESIINILTHLMDYTGSSTTYTLTLHDDCKTLMETQGEVEVLGGKTYDRYISDIGWTLA